jgi:hypothetical protein
MVSAVLISIEERTGMKKELLTVKELADELRCVNCPKLPYAAANCLIPFTRSRR